ncbi:hypothetical protein VP01_3097g4 [Puccinia sorghi]|uniref:Uncharacterized protein n=1 Tax=Puccinia sorghi TaxID=27349 RepID=A0A0L6V0C2_9BASI|nr:hypothetical protein VP01_3097g4 [Puccinia sorghi]
MESGPGPPNCYQQPPPSNFWLLSIVFLTISFAAIMSTVDEILRDHLNPVEPPFENSQGDCPVPYLAPARNETQDSWPQQNPQPQAPRDRPQAKEAPTPPGPIQHNCTINIKCYVFICTANNLLSEPPNTKSTGTSKDWEKVHPLKETMWDTPILDLSWLEFQKALLCFLEKDRTHLGVHLAKLHGSRLLKWKCILFGHCVYGNKGNYIVTQDSEFSPFLKAAKAQEDSLALSYGPEDERLALEQLHAWLAANVSDFHNHCALAVLNDCIQPKANTCMAVPRRQCGSKTRWTPFDQSELTARIFGSGSGQSSTRQKELIFSHLLNQAIVYQKIQKILTMNEHVAILAKHAKLKGIHSSLRSCSSNVELIGQGPPPSSVNCSPARKLPRSPAGEGVAHTLSQLNFEHLQSPKNYHNSPPQNTHSPSISLTNTPSSNPSPAVSINRFSTLVGTHGQSVRVDRLAPSDNQALDPLTTVAHIRHWSYFQEASLSELQDMCFPLPIARQLKSSAVALVLTHVATDMVMSPEY